MLPNSMDAAGAFSHLSENIPSWITRLSDLRVHTASKRQEYIEAFKVHGIVKPRRRKNSSICSIRTEDAKKPPVPDSTHGAIDQETSSGSPKKRSAESTDEDEPQQFVSTRYNIIIHYDGHTQKVLEDIVRCIGVARSHIRRGKLSQRPLGGLRSGSMFSRAVKVSPSTAILKNREDSEDMGPPNFRSTLEKPSNSPFDSADKLLEVAHSLCETAAHQFLRVGDCAVELQSVEDNFNSLLGMASAEVERLGEGRKEEEQREEKEKPRTEEAQVGQSTKRPADEGDQPKVMSAIEVDDDAASTVSTESIDLTAFRAKRLNRS